jgi:hypothetical protein
MSPCNPCKRPPFAIYAPIRQSLKQSLLGASLTGQLCILPPSISETSFHTTFITQLSDELLNEIFTHALSGEQELRRPSFSQRALALSKVSKRFYRIVQPLMYNSIYLSNHYMAPPCIAVKLLHRTMKENQVLGSMVRRLFVHIDYHTTVTDEKFTIGRELLSIFQNVEAFDLHGGYDRPSTWPMIKRAFKNWPRLMHITLSREYSGPLIVPVCEIILVTPSLKTMNLHGITAPSFPNNTPRPTWVDHTSNIMELTIHDFGDTPEALQKLLKLPRALEHFTFGAMYSNPDPSRWRLETFQWLLADHQNTLKSIEISSSGGGYSPINFMEYPKLERLKLSHWVYRETAETAAASILAPKLHTFIWDFTVYDQHSEHWTDFDQPQKKWLLKFAELAAARKNSALKRIKIIFLPDTWEYITSREALAACVTPWDMMDEVKAKIKPLGIELEYNECWTRYECLKSIERAEREESL